MKEPIKKIRLKDGTVRYRLVVDIGRDENGRRKQLTRTFKTLANAREELSRIRHETNLGTYVKRSKETVNACLDGYLKGATRDLRASTKRNYEDALWPVRERLGTRPLQSITKSDVEDLVDWILTAGRRRGGKPGTGLSGRSARLTLGRFSAALDAAVLEGKLVRNVGWCSASALLAGRRPWSSPGTCVRCPRQARCRWSRGAGTSAAAGSTGRPRCGTPRAGWSPRAASSPGWAVARDGPGRPEPRPGWPQPHTQPGVTARPGQGTLLIFQTSTEPMTATTAVPANSVG